MFKGERVIMRAKKDILTNFGYSYFLRKGRDYKIRKHPENNYLYCFEDSYQKITHRVDKDFIEEHFLELCDKNFVALLKLEMELKASKIEHSLKYGEELSLSFNEHDYRIYAPEWGVVQSGTSPKNKK